MAAAKRMVPSALYERLDPFEAAIQKFVSHVAAETGDGARVLDAGAGECRFKPLFARARYVGVDFAQGDPAWDYSKLDAVARLEALPFPDGVFDHVISIVVLEHTPEPSKVIHEFERPLDFVQSGLTITMLRLEHRDPDVLRGPDIFHER